MGTSQLNQIEVVKDSVTNGLLVALAILGLPLLIVTAIFVIPKGHWGVLAAYLILYGILVITAVFRRNISVRKRAFIGLSACYLMAAIVLFRAGVLGIGPYVLFTFALICSILFGNRAGILAVIFGVCTIAAAAVATITGLVELNQDVILAIGTPVSWIVGASVFALFSLSIIFSFSLLQGHLFKSIESLAEKTEKLDAANRRLQDEITRVEQMQGALKKSERKYRLLAEYAADVIWTMNADFEFTYFSPAVERVYGYTIDQATGKHLEEMIVSDSIDKTLNPIRQAMSRERGGEHLTEPLLLDVEQVRADGTLFWTEMTFSFVNIDGGEDFFIRGVTRDISEKRRQEVEKANLERRMRQAEKMEAVGTFAGGIAHDVNNILHVILTRSDLILDQTDDAEGIKKEAQRIIKSVYQAADLIDKLLVFSRTGKVEANPFVFKEVVAETIETLQNQVPSEIQLTSKLSTDDGCVIGEPGQISRMLINLANNSIAAMEGTGGTLEIDVDEIKIDDICPDCLEPITPGLYFRLTVADTGHGIDPNLLPHIFEPFFTTKDVGEGTGLGLSVVHGIATAHGGCVSVKSEKGKGSIFTVYLPYSPCEPTPEVDEVVDVQAGTGTLLFVDDEPQLIDLGKRFLGSAGYQVVVASGGVEAIEKIKLNPGGIDLLITDQNMPGITGLDLISKVKEILPGLKAILVTGRADDSIIRKVENIDYVALVPKPFTFDKLIIEISKLLSDS